MDERHLGLIGLTNTVIDKSILEVNNAPNVLILKYANGKRKLLTAKQHPSWMIQMYETSGIEIQVNTLENITEQGWDEVWVVNALQEATDLNRFLFNIKHSSGMLRIYQTIDDRITRAILDAGLGIVGAVTTLTDGFNQIQVYYGCYDLQSGEKIPLQSNMRFWGGNTERAMIHYLKTKYGKRLVMAEIGVLYGINAKFILDTLNIKHLYLIDSYQQYDTDIYSQADLDQAKTNARALLAPYKDRITWLYVRSLDAISILRNMQVEFDATYYDGDHSYTGTFENIEAYNSITRLCLGGHDYIPDSDNPGCKYGVMSAVRDWTANKQYNFFCSEFPYSDWWVDKELRR